MVSALLIVDIFDILINANVTHAHADSTNGRDEEVERINPLKPFCAKIILIEELCLRYNDFISCGVRAGEH
ncbi:hypothetical protein PsorP6_003576 [Peronosclerospora sorghi]|uniref:Uncharacterized protein n=1 Tax=Peronosclerospora sorghi TaxID=230839 RepID=A0ACC0VNN2_9STRA|nr:hypothetical protein PsorP6_003576 [Peronosclerospora sorghi]